MNWVKPVIALAVSVGLVTLAAGCRPKPAGAGPSAQVVEAMNRGVSLMGQYEYDAAVKAFEEVLAIEPALAEARVNLAIALFNRARKEDRDLERSGELLDAVLQSDARQVHAWYFKGIVLQHIGRAEAAIACFEQVVQQRPDDGVAWYLLGMCKQRLGQKAEGDLRKAIQLRPNLASAYYVLWQSQRAAGELDKAQPLLDKFKQLRENPMAETIELPQYNHMGDLALARPLPAKNTPPITPSAYTVQPAQRLYEAKAPLLPAARSKSPSPAATPPLALGGAALGDLNRDGLVDLVLTAQGEDGGGRLVLLHGQAAGGFVEAATGSGLASMPGALACALGDFDNDENVDLFVTGFGGNRLFRGQSDGTWVDVTRPTGIGESSAGARSGLFLDADHDGDLDIFVCGAAPAGNQLWNNNSDGTFTNIALSAGIACAGSTSVMVLPGDLDGDRDLDLVVLREGQPATVFLNDLLGKYHEADASGSRLQGDLGGVLQDFNGDARLDAMVAGGQPAGLRLFLGDGRGHFLPDAAFARCAEAAASWGAIRGLRVVDLDLDGDLDVVAFSADAHLLLNDGAGRFVLQPQRWKSPEPNEWAGVEILDLNGDYVADLLTIESGPKPLVALRPGVLTPPSTALSIVPTGLRGRDKRTRSPATGYGVAMTLRAGLREQSRVFSGQTGGFNQSPTPIVYGLGGMRQADYVRFLWPDGVAQVEATMAAGQLHKIAELQRKISSCPVLFAWNGRRFEFITDFAGVGGLGYFIAPGEYAQPQALEHVKIEPEQLGALDGFYELRITEPMEEAAFIDRLELQAVDHPAAWRVFPDERLAVTGSPPTHELLRVDQPLFPKRAVDPRGRDCTERLARVDRRYAYAPELDRRFFGFCRSHTLELDFGGQLADLTAQTPLHLFIHGYLEYPFSQTAYGASQARVGWEPIRIDRLMPDGAWQTVVPDAGVLGGMARMMTVDLTGLAAGPECRLRLTSNLEIYYDQVFLARDAGRDPVSIHAVPLVAAELRRVGFAREFSPDGGMPLIYDYDLCDATAPFHVLRGAYTRYGPVSELLQAFDDQYVIVGPGDELAVKFDASKLPAPAPGTIRSFVLISHAYCKDMDLYTATPQTLEPLPFRGMSRYPYPENERYPETREHRQYRATYNTRIVD